MDRKRFSVVIPYIDGGVPHAMKLLPSLKGVGEVIFVGAATDGTTEWLKAQKGVTVVENPNGPSPYGENVNLGVRAAKGEWVFVLNIDTVVGEEFFERMLRDPGTGMTGPLSNWVLPDQQIEPAHPQDVEAVNAALKGRPHQDAPIISGLAFLIKRETFLSIGGFDPSLKNGDEDTDLSLRLLKKGYTNKIAYDTYIWHKGGQGGVHNRHLLAEKHQSTEWRIGCYVRVRARREEIERWLRRHYPIFDEIIFIDDGSPFNWEEVRSQWRGITVLKAEGLSEGEQRALGVEVARQKGVTALVNLDHDEFLEPKVTREELVRLLSLPLPTTLGFVARFLHLWNSPNQFNVSYPPQEHLFMIRLLPGIKYRFDPSKRFHVPRLPQLTKSTMTPTNIRIVHEGYMDPSVRERKRAYYEENDPVKDPKDIGREGYAHMTDQRKLVLGEWTGRSEDYTISGNMMAEKEEPHTLQIALETLAPITDDLVLRVGPDREDLAAIGRRFGATLIRTPWKQDFAVHRNEMLAKSKGSYVFYLDPDEQLPWPGEIPELVNYRPSGAIFTISHPGGLESRAIRLFRREGAVFDGMVHEHVKVRRPVRAKGTIIHLRRPLQRYREMNKEMIRRCPEDPRPWFDEGLRTIFDGNFPKGVALIRKAIRLAPDEKEMKATLVRVLLTWARLLAKESNVEVS